MSTQLPIVSLVVRLRPEPAGHGELIGSAEIVETGEVVHVRHADDLARLVTRIAVAGDRR